MLAGKGERNLLEELAILINLSCPFMSMASNIAEGGSEQVQHPQT